MPQNQSPNMSNEDKQIIVEIWKKTVEVQQHFNDIEMRIRNFALTALTFIITGIGFLIHEKIFITLFSIKIPAASVFALFGVIIIMAFFFMDKVWYHRLLLGSVKHGIKIETKYANVIPELELSKSIKEESPVTYLWKEMHSNDKLIFFYRSIITVLLLISVSFLFGSKIDSIENKGQELLGQKPIEIDNISLAKIPPKPGVVLFMHNNSVIYVCSSKNVKSEIINSFSSSKHQIYIYLQDEYKMAFSEEEYKDIAFYNFSKEIQVKYLADFIGRLELKEYVIEKENPKLNTE